MDSEGLLFGDVTIVELGQYIAAPYCAELLAHGGATVTSVEPVSGGPTRHNSTLGSPEDGDGRQYVIKARGKQAVPVNLSSSEGATIVRELVRRADVLITNLRPGLSNELGLGWDQLRTEQPSLIFAEVNGFGDRGPLRNEAFVDIVAQAASGLMRSIGRREEGRAVPSDVMIADYTAGSLLAFGIASALRQRDKTGRGQRVATSLMAACMTAQHRRANRFDRVDDWHADLATMVNPDAVDPSASGGGGAVDIDAITAWREEQLGTAPYFYNCYAVDDGEVAVGAVAANGRRLLGIAGIDPADLETPTRLRGMTVAETSDMVAAMLTDRSADALVDELRAAGVPAAKVAFLEEAMASADLHAAGLFHTFDHPRLGPTVMPAPPVTFSDTSYTASDNTPRFGEHTDQVLRELGYEDALIDRLVEDGIVARQAS